ncbi:MAG: NAD(P)-dependent oxidoreductase [Syntrophomonadaceae bacterium]|jgi:nucleoside-diphosphate-sugar epimerase|nr:NAD(P)-dependent oxidoreductase [Syntrophomonadaceae bacterium]MDH7497044.1 NAD(P)-dependent oxidoreductase [Syntrophomonadaceae bacterium]
MRVVITGATGIIGTALTEYCILHDVSVVAVVRPESRKVARLPSGNQRLEIVECDLQQIERLPSLVSGTADVFFHLGWGGHGIANRHEVCLQSLDISHTLKAVLAANALGCTRFVGAGSQAEYGRLTRPATPDLPVKPENAYGIAKFAAGRMSALLSRQVGITHTWARIFSVYGPNDSHDGMIVYAIRKLLQGEAPALTRCEQVWDYLYCSDAARALFLLGLHGKDQAIYNVGSGVARPLLDYVRILRDAIDPSLPLGIGEREYGENQVMYLCADIETLRRDTGFEPQVPFEEGIRRTIEWCRAQQDWSTHH